MRKKAKQSKVKKSNIPLRRKIAVLYFRTLLLCKLAAITTILLFCFTSYFAGIKNEIRQQIYEFTSNIGFRLENIIIEGQNTIEEGEILAALNADKGTPIFAIDLEAIKANLKANSWIKEVLLIQRKLPNTLYIKLLERIPIAIWQNKGQIFLIDDEGYKITTDVLGFSSLLHVVGSDANIYTNQLVEDLGKHATIAQKTISAVRFGQRRWDLNLEQGIIVKMPDSNFDKALNYIANLNKKNLLFDQNYKIIDLRDSNKFYVEKY